MAQKISVLLVCDLHDGEVEGVETVAFGLDGSSFEIDVCDEHAAQLRNAFAPYLGAARRAGRAAGNPARRRPGRVVRAPGAGSGQVSAERQRVRDVRDWARRNGHQVSERGRLSSAVMAAYEAAH